MIFSKKAKIFGKFVTVFVMISMLASVFGGFELIPAYASEDDGLAAAVEKLVIKNIDSPENGITLDPVVGDGLGNDKKGTETHGYDVSWSSSDTSVITNTGVVHPSTVEAKTVTMTATVTSRATGGSQDKTFTVNVPKVQPYKINNVYITGDGIRDTLLVGGKTVSEVSLTRYAASGDGAAVVILGLYDGNVLVDAVTNTLADSTMAPFSDKNVTLSNKLTLPATIKDTHSLKVFVFNSKSNVSPLAKMTVYGKDTGSDAKIYIIGDSTVQSYNKDDAAIAKYNPQNGWGAYISENFGLTVNNYAVGGTSTRSYLEKDGYTNASKLQKIGKGDFLLIQFGGNDMKDDYLLDHTTVNLNAEKTDFDYTKSNTFASYLQIYVDFAREKGATPVFVSSPSRAYLDKDGRGDYPTAMRLFAAKKGLPYVNLTAATTELYNEVPDYYKNYFLIWNTPADANGHSPETMVAKFGDFGTNYAGKEENTDLTHFNIDGAKMAAHLVSAGIVENNLPIKRYNTTSLTTVAAAVAAEAANPPIPPVVEQPEDPASEITGLTATSKANGVSLTWDALEGATSYDVYRDDVIVKTVETTSFDDKYFSTLENYLGETTNGIAEGLTGGKTGTITAEHTYVVKSNNNGESTPITAKAAPEKLVWFSVPQADDYSVYGKEGKNGAVPLVQHGVTSNRLRIGEPSGTPYRVLTQLNTPVQLKGDDYSAGTTLYQYKGSLTEGEYFYIGDNYKGKTAVGYVIANTSDTTSDSTNQLKFTYTGSATTEDGLNPKEGYTAGDTEDYIVLLNAALEDCVKQLDVKNWKVFGPKVDKPLQAVSVVPDVAGTNITARVSSNRYLIPGDLADLTDEQSWATYVLEVTSTKDGTSNDGNFVLARTAVSPTNYSNYFHQTTGRQYGYHSVTVLKASDYIK